MVSRILIKSDSALKAKLNTASKQTNKRLHHGQIDFLPRMQEWFSIRKSVNVMYHINTLRECRRAKLLKCNCVRHRSHFLEGEKKGTRS